MRPTVNTGTHTKSQTKIRKDDCKGCWLVGQRDQKEGSKPCTDFSRMSFAEAEAYMAGYDGRELPPPAKSARYRPRTSISQYIRCGGRQQFGN